MTADIRTAAQREAEVRVNIFRQHVGWADSDSTWWRTGFRDGAVWAAARVTPTREQIAGVIRNHWYSNAQLTCECGATPLPKQHADHVAEEIESLQHELTRRKSDE